MSYLEKAIAISTAAENCESDNWGDWVNLCGEADREIAKLQAQLEAIRKKDSTRKNN